MTRPRRERVYLARMARGVWVAAVIVLAGCGGGEEPAARTPAPTAVVTATPAPPEVPAAEEVTFRATDGEPVRGEYTAAASADAPAIVLLHELRGGRTAGRTSSRTCTRPGSRCSPTSRAARRSRATGCRTRSARCAGCARRAERVGLVGASVGASTTVLAMAIEARARRSTAGVALSPPEVAGHLGAAGERPLSPARPAVRGRRAGGAGVGGDAQAARVNSELVRSPTPGHGIVLLGDPGIREAVISWLRERLG